MAVKARDDVTLANVNDVTASVRYYQLKASTASAPAAPTVYPAPSPWVAAEPSYSDGATNSLYTIDVTVFSDGSFDYSTVSLSSSYEAAKSAWNKAQAAQTSATSAQTAANLALANAQELVRNPTMRSDVSNPDGWPSTVALGASGAPSNPPTPFTTYAKVTDRDHLASWTLPNIPGRVLQYTIYAVADSTANHMLQFGVQYSDTGNNMHWDTAIRVGVAQGQAGWAKYVGTWTVPDNISSDTNWPCPWLEIDTFASDYGWYVTGLSIKDITEAAAAQQAAVAAKTTADGKNRIIHSESEPDHTGLVQGDLWFQLDSSQHVTGIQVWDGSVFVDYLVVANQILVAGSVGTVQIANGAVTANQIGANAVTAIKMAAQTITGDKLDVGSVAAAIVTSGKFQTSNGRMLINDDGLTAKDASGNTTVDIPSDGSTPTMVGGFSTAHSGRRITITQDTNDSGTLALRTDDSVLAQLAMDASTLATDGYVHVGLGAGQATGLTFNVLADSANHAPDPRAYDIQLTSASADNGRIWIGGKATQVQGTWFANSVVNLPTSPNVVGGSGTMAFVGGVEYVFDGAGAWVPQTSRVFAGSKILSNVGTYASLLTGAQITQICGRAFNNNTDCIMAMNGDVGASGSIITGTGWVPSQDQAVIWLSGSTPLIRVNYMIILGK